MNMRLTSTRKSLGQHWLHDKASLEAMCDAAEVGKGDVVLEVGPGTGTLTAVLIDAGAKVIAVEKDEALAKGLVSRFGNGSLQLYGEDILEFDLTALPPGYKVAANIPYYLTSNLLRLLSESSNPPDRMALLVQKEVAERIVAGPGQMSLLGVSVQFYNEVSLGPIVPAKLFTPPPKVDSQIIKLVRHSRPLFPDVDTKAFFWLVKAGFSNRRKTLLNSLAAGLRIDKEKVKELLECAAVDPQTRPQELSLEYWHKIYLALR